MKKNNKKDEIFDYVILDSNNNWLHFGRGKTVKEMIDEIGDKKDELDEEEEIIVYYAPKLFELVIKK